MESTQERITCAARKLFGENGFHGTTTAELARAAGVAEGTIYRYFKDKRELLIACVKPVIAEAIRRETAVASGASPRQILKGRIMERVRVVRENLDLFNILFSEGRQYPELAQILIGQLQDSIPEQEWQLLMGAVASGAMKRPPNPLIMNVGITAAIWAMVSVGPAADVLFAAWPTPPRYDRLAEDLAEFVCAGLMGEEHFA